MIKKSLCTWWCTLIVRCTETLWSPCTSTHITKTTTQLSKHPHMRCCYILLNSESKLKNPYSSVSVVTRIQVSKYGFRFSEGKKDFPLETSRPPLEPTQPPTEWVTRTFLRGKSSKAWRWQLRSSRTVVKNGWSVATSPPIRVHVVEREIFVFS